MLPLLSLLGLFLLAMGLGGQAEAAATAEGPVRPCCVATWRFGAIAVRESSRLLSEGASALDAVERGINAVELDTADQYFVGRGGLPNAEGVMEFDAALMDHEQRYSAVLALQSVDVPVSVARAVLEHSPHNVLSGQGALQFALQHGFKADPTVLTETARQEWLDWKQAQAAAAAAAAAAASNADTVAGAGAGAAAEDKGHDTVGLICLDAQGRLACGTSTSGWKFKHPGRIGDSPLAGAGLFCDGAVGAAVCTGDGEEIQRSCLSFLVVELMRGGLSPQAACAEGVRRMATLRPKRGASSGASSGASTSTSTGSGMYTALTVGVVAMDTRGNVGAASTLCEDNRHRGHPFFPASCWRLGSAHGAGAEAAPGAAPGAGAGPEDGVTILEASVKGATF